MRGYHPTNRSHCVWSVSKGNDGHSRLLVLRRHHGLLAGATLIWPGTALEHTWILNSPAHEQLAPFGKAVGIPFLVLSAALAAAGTGWFRRRLWGWRLAVLIVAAWAEGRVESVEDVAGCAGCNEHHGE